ncbi:MAG: ABC transporter substrate-binding protein [Actinomycetota bacterium]|nr:ABC transporter substrate-binding protein [Actinomycetota bacterium]
MAGARRAAVVLLALALAGCGSTVQTRGDLTSYGEQPGLGTSQGQGLAGTAGGSTTAGTGGTAVPGSTGSLPAGATGTTSATQPGGTSATGAVPTPGGARNTSPISIGIVLTGTSNADSFGISMGNTLSEESIDRALVAAMNEQGGLNGRKIDPVFAYTDTGSNNWESDFSAACATFTQDNHVVAVLGYVFNYFSSFESCLAKKGIPHLNTGFNIPDAQELRPFPLHVALDVPTIDRRTLTKLEMGVADGVLTPKSRIGVLRDTCPGTGRSFDQVLVPTAKRLHLNVVKDIQITCSNGQADSGSAVQALQSAVLQFASSQVDRVVFHSVSEGPALLLFSLSAESQGYRPGYVVTSLANFESLKSYYPAAQRSGIHGYGWMPTQDIPPAAYPKPNVVQSRCLALLASKRIKPVAGPDYYYAYNICEAFFVYELALKRTAGASDGNGILAAVKGLGTSFASLTNAGGSAFTSTVPDAPRAARHLTYFGGCSCFRYSGPARAIPFR